ncbi:MAG: hypothetical protein HC806_00990 [Anaerolineae bacterium]|nr:hypothetical protein [Anaerolineae bacterium]
MSDVYTTPDGVRHVVRMVRYLPGQVMGEAPITPGMRRNVGDLLARLNLALRGFSIPALGTTIRGTSPAVWGCDRRPFTSQTKPAAEIVR